MSNSNDSKMSRWPEGWQLIRLGKLIKEAQSGFACGEREKNGVIQLRMNNVDTSGNMVWDNFIRVPANDEKILRYRLEPNDVLFNNTNSTELVGKTALFSGHSENVVYSNHFTRLRVNTDEIDPGYLASWLNHLWNSKIFENLCNRWIGQSAVKHDKLLNLEIPLPILSEQKRIVAILNSKKSVINRARAATMAQLMVAKALPSAYLRTIFDSPESKKWPVEELQGLCLSPGQYGLSEKANNKEGLPILRMMNIYEGEIKWNDLKYIELSNSKKEKYLLYEGDLLFNRTNSAELVGKTAIFDGSREAVFASYLIRFRLNKNIADPRFVSYYINSEFGREFIKKKMARAIGQVNISASTMHHMPIPLPPLSLQNQISELLSVKFETTKRLRYSLQKQSEYMNKVSPALLRCAFNGDL